VANLSAIPNESFFGRMLRAPLRMIPRTAVVPILQGALRGKKWVVGSGNHGCWLGSYEFEKQKAFQGSLQPGNVVYDIGANAGFYTLLASALVGDAGHVYSFEPLRDNVDKIQRHLELNHVRNCTVYDVAVSSSDGFAGFDPAGDPHMGRLAAGGKVAVRTVALDHLVSSGEILAPSFMKIDIEGAEYDALQGCAATIAKSRPIIFLATHGEDIHHACLRLLADWNYEVTSLDGRPIVSSDELIARPRE
jgi:FkbM family methyltransferase